MIPYTWLGLTDYQAEVAIAVAGMVAATYLAYRLMRFIARRWWGQE